MKLCECTSVNNIVLVTVIQRATYLPGELAGYSLPQPAMADDVVEHLASVDILEQHVPVVVCPDNIAHAADVRVVGQCDDCCFSCCADLLAVFCSFALCSRAVLSIIRSSGYNLDGDLLSSLFVPR